MSASPGTAAVRTRGLTKRYGPVTVVDNLDLAVPSGSVYGFLGPNGSGKTTTLRMLLGLVAATAGEAHVLGRAVPASSAAVLPRVGALIEGPAFHPDLSARANLARVDIADPSASRRDRPARIESALERVGLSGVGRRRVRAYSSGMTQRLGLAATLLRPRELVVLDEPTNALDPQGTHLVRDLVQEWHADGVTVLLSSHLLAEVSRLCTHLGVLARGRLVAQGPLADVVGAPRLVLQTPDVGAALPVLAAAGLAAVVERQGRLVAPLSGAAGEVVAGLTPSLVAAGVRIESISGEQPGVEEAYVALTGRDGTDVG
ncbi:MAG: ABC transporter ATP-binding protein [Kineosporiaceae bacterium]